MKKIFVILTIITAISFIFISCGGSGSRATAEVKKPEPPINVTPAPLPELTDAQKAEREPFEFWAQKVEVEPMVVNENDTWGEAQESGVSMRYVFYFTDSVGNQKELIINEFYPKVKPAENSEDFAYYKRSLDDFNKSKALYEKITNMPERSIYVTGTGRYIRALQKKSDPTLKKIGTAIVKKEPMEDLWVSPY